MCAHLLPREHFRVDLTPKVLTLVARPPGWRRAKRDLLKALELDLCAYRLFSFVFLLQFEFSLERAVSQRATAVSARYF